MTNILDQIKQKLGKPLLFGLYGAMGCLGAAALFGEPLLALTKIEPTPQAILLLIDCSGSMDENNKLTETKNAARAFVQRQDLSKKNRIAVAGFGSNVQIGSHLSNDKLSLDQAIVSLSDGGGTKMDVAIETVAKELVSPEYKTHILLFTDGQPGYAGANEEEEKSKTLNAGRAAQDHGISIVAVATGDAKADFLTDLTGDRSRVFYANSGNIDQAFQQAEKALKGLVETKESGGSLLYAILRIGAWTAILAIGTSLVLIIAQNQYLRRRLLSIKEGSIGTVGSLASGMAAGAIGQLLFTSVAGVSILASGGQVVGWAVLGSLLGGGMSFFVPNLKRDRALLGGAIGGVIGGISFLLVSTISGDIVGRLIGAGTIGFFIGLMLALIEQLSREAWLIVHWTPKEQSKISLGTTPILLGSSEDAHVYLQGYPAKTAEIYLKGDKIIMQFDQEMAKKGMKKLDHELTDGQTRKFGNIEIEVKTSK